MFKFYYKLSIDFFCRACAIYRIYDVDSLTELIVDLLEWLRKNRPNIETMNLS